MLDNTTLEKGSIAKHSSPAGPTQGTSNLDSHLGHIKEVGVIRLLPLP